MHQNVKTFVADLEFTCIYTHTLEEMHAEFHCHYMPNPESRPCSTEVITRCHTKRYSATAAQTRRVDRAAVERCMRSYHALQPKPRK